MVNLLLCGAGGTMGRKVVEAAERNNNIKISAGIGRSEDINLRASFHVYDSFDKVTEPIDVILDFSHHSALEAVLGYALKTKKPLVIATTGYTPEQEKLILEKSKNLPIFRSSNFSLGVYRFVETVANFAKNWDGDIEIIETHHNQKKDAPSGTALTICDAIIKARGCGKRVPGRGPNDGKREPGDIGISAVRGGVVAGEHQVRFFNETCELSFVEREYGKESFAKGALTACEFMAKKTAKNGFYTMKDLMA